MGREVQVGVRREAENDSGNGSKCKGNYERKKEDRGGGGEKNGMHNNIRLEV